MKLRFFENTVKPVVCTIIPHSTDYSRLTEGASCGDEVDVEPNGACYSLRSDWILEWTTQDSGSTQWALDTKPSGF